MDEDVPPPPLPKRPTIIRGASRSQPEPPGVGTNEHPTNDLPPPRIPVRPAPPKPGGPPKPNGPPKPGGPPKPVSRPASVHVPSTKPPPSRPSEKSNGTSSGKRKIEITIVDARPMSEIGFRDIEGPPTKPLPSPKSPHNAPSTEESKPKPSIPTPVTSPPPLPSRSDEKRSSPPTADSNDGGTKALPSRPKRPTIIRPGKSASTNEEAPPKDSIPAAHDKVQNGNTAPDKSPRLPKAVPTSQSTESVPNEGLEAKSETNQTDDTQPPDIPVAPAKPKRPTVIRPSKPSVEDSGTEDKKNDVEGSSPPLLPSRPGRPSANKPPPLPSRSPASSHQSTSPPPPAKSPRLSPQAPLRSSENSTERRPLPKPRPRSVAVTSNALSSPPSDGKEDSLSEHKTKDSAVLKPSSPPALPVRAPRPASSFTPSSTAIMFPEKESTKTSSHIFTERSSQEKAPPTHPKPPTPTAPRKMHLPPRPSAPPVKKTDDSDFLNALQDDGNTYATIDGVKDSHESIETSYVKEDISHSDEIKPSSETSGPADNAEKEETPVYSKINKPIKRPVPRKPPNDEAEDAGGEKSSSAFPFKVKLKSTLSPSDESKEDTKPSEMTKAPFQTEESQAPVIAPKPKPKPSLKPRPQPAVKPKPTSPKNMETRKSLESDPSAAKACEEEKETAKHSHNTDQNQECRTPLLATATKTDKTQSHRGENETTETDVYSEIQDNRMNKGDTASPQNVQSPPEKPVPPLPSRRPVRMIGRPSIKKDENDSKSTGGPDQSQQEGKAEAQDASTPISTSEPGCPSFNENEVESSVEQNLSMVKDESDLSGVKVPKDSNDYDPDQNGPSGAPTRKKPVRIIGFPQRSSTVEMEKEDANDNDKDAPSVPERKSSPSSRPPPPRPTSRPLPPPPQPSHNASEAANRVLKPSSDSALTGDEEKSDAPPEVPPPSSMQAEDEIAESKSEAVMEKGSSPPSRRPPPIARPPPPRRASNDSSTSLAHPTTADSLPSDQEKFADDRPDITNPSEMKIEAAETNTDTQINSFQPSGSGATEPPKPPRSSLPPPRPTSAAHRRSSESGQGGGSPVEKTPVGGKPPPRPQPSRPLPPKSDRRKSVPAGPPALPPRPGPGHILYSYLANQPHAIALHDYTASQPDELSFQAGQTVILTKEVDDQWLSGRVGDQEGIFPRPFVEMKCPLGSQGAASSTPSWQDNTDGWPIQDDFDKFNVVEEKPDNIIGPRCRARFDFEGCGEGELVLEDGDVIKLVSHVGSEWLKGELNGRVGIFPSAYVEIIEDLPPDSTDASEESASALETEAIFDYEGQAGDLSFQAGDRILLRGQINTEWLYGECGGSQGQFPASFVSSVPPGLPTFDPSSLTNDDTQNDVATAAAAAHTLTDFPDHLTESPPSVEQGPPASCLGVCVAVHDYDSETPGDLQFKSGDRIEITEFIGDDWLSGRLDDVEGIFPKVFVEVEENHQPPEKAEPEEVWGKAIHPFSGHDDTELTFEEGSVIQLEDFVDENQEWRFGMFEGKRGMFPSAFVEPV